MPGPRSSPGSPRSAVSQSGPRSRAPGMAFDSLTKTPSPRARPALRGSCPPLRARTRYCPPMLRTSGTRRSAAPWSVRCSRLPFGSDRMGRLQNVNGPKPMVVLRTLSRPRCSMTASRRRLESRLTGVGAGEWRTPMRRRPPAQGAAERAQRGIQAGVEQVVQAEQIVHARQHVSAGPCDAGHLLHRPIGRVQPRQDAERQDEGVRSIREWKVVRVCLRRCRTRSSRSRSRASWSVSPIMAGARIDRGDEQAASRRERPRSGPLRTRSRARARRLAAPARRSSRGRSPGAPGRSGREPSAPRRSSSSPAPPIRNAGRPAPVALHWTQPFASRRARASRRLRPTTSRANARPIAPPKACDQARQKGARSSCAK